MVDHLTLMSDDTWRRPGVSVAVVVLPLQTEAGVTLTTEDESDLHA